MARGGWSLLFLALSGCGARTIAEHFGEDASIGDAHDAADTADARDTAIDTSVVDTSRDSGVDTGPLDTGPLDTGPLDTGPLDTGPPDTGCAVLEAGPPAAPAVKVVSGSCNLSAATLKRCDRAAKCPGGDCVSDCDSCQCTGGTLGCTESICATSGAVCPTRVPAAWSKCEGSCVCEYDSGCAGLTHRAACVGGRFQVNYSACAPRCPDGMPATGAPCWTEGLVCSYRGSACTDVNVVCDRTGFRPAPWASGSTWSFTGPKTLCPPAPPRSGDACKPDFVVGQRCDYTSAAGEYQYCSCIGGRFACWNGLSRAIPGMEAAPQGRCAVAPWCMAKGECCTMGYPKEGCTCTADGMQCGPGNGC